MKVEVLAVAPLANDRSRVLARTPVGRLELTWRGAPPSVGDVRAVELSFPDPIDWRSDSGTIRLEVLVERREPDGVLVLRVGDSIVLAESVGEAPPEGTRTWIHVAAVAAWDVRI